VSAAGGELPVQGLHRPVEGQIGGLGSVGVTGRLREPVAGARVAVDRDLATGVPEPLLERRDILGRLVRILFGEVPDDRRARRGQGRAG
jgi:hypothetical protein